MLFEAQTSSHFPRGILHRCNRFSSSMIHQSELDWNRFPLRDWKENVFSSMVFQEKNHGKEKNKEAHR